MKVLQGSIERPLTSHGETAEGNPVDKAPALS
jgi:hypothetical protein